MTTNEGLDHPLDARQDLDAARDANDPFTRLRNLPPDIEAAWGFLQAMNVVMGNAMRCTHQRACHWLGVLMRGH
jgi:hypothetical protein